MVILVAGIQTFSDILNRHTVFWAVFNCDKQHITDVVKPVATVVLMAKEA